MQSSSSIYETVTNPITGVGRVAINATLDKFTLAKYNLTAEQPEAIIKRYEPVFVSPDMAGTANYNRLGGGTDNGLRVVSHVPAQMLKDHKNFLDKIIFVGFADGEADQSQGPADIAVRIGGLATVINTGSDRIDRGSFVCYDLPVQNPRWATRPTEKRLLGLTPLKYGAADEDASKAMLEVAGVNVADTDAILARLMGGEDVASSSVVKSLASKFKDDAEKKAAVSLILAANRAALNMRRRVIGRALSAAEPGKPFDILLGGYSI